MPAWRIDGERLIAKVNGRPEIGPSPSHASRSGTLASRRGTWQGAGMDKSSPSAGGALIALGAVGGAAIGFLVGEATPGFLIGVTLGIAASLIIWWRGTRRR